MLKLVKYLKGYGAVSILAPLFKLFEAALELLVPVIVARLIDRGILNGDTAYVLKMGGLLLGIGVMGLVMSLTAQYFCAKSAGGFGTALRRALFSHINTFSSKEMDSFGIPTLITRVTSDAMQAQTGVNMFLRLFLRAPFIIIGAIAAAFLIDYRAGLIFLTATPLLGLVMFLTIKKNLPVYKSVQENIEGINLITRENLDGVRVIRAFRRQDEEVARFDSGSEKLASLQIKAGKIAALNNPLSYVIVNLAIISLLYFGGRFVDYGTLLQGEVIALINYMTQISISIVAVSFLVTVLTKASASAQRISAVLDTENSILGAETSPNIIDTDIALEFEKVCFRYGGEGKYAVAETCIAIKRGQNIGIIGGTGSGKTTLISLVPRFYEVTSGAVRVDGINVKDYPLAQLRKKVCVVAQKPILFRGTLRDNIALGNENAGETEIMEALDIAQAVEVCERLGGLDGHIEDKGGNLSGGQKQRLSIARAVAAKPEILILDDSTSALDYATEAALRRRINKAFKAATVIWVSQRASSVKACDKIIVMHDGEVAGFGTHRYLVENCPVYKEICLSQGECGEAL